MSEEARAARPDRVHVKVCGVTSPEDARLCVEAGVSAIGVNLVPGTPRCVSVAEARAVAEAVGSVVLVVAVVRDLSPARMIALRTETMTGCLQLHGDEPPEHLVPLLPHAYKAIAVGTAADVARADLYGGAYLLVDGKAPEGWGGMGKSFDWRLVEALARRRKLAVAGGLTPDNVGGAIAIVRPHTVDVASGVEVPGQPRRKDPARVRAFIAAVQAATAP